jgi:hypothetical protein
VDAATRAIALNNQLSIEPHSNPFENYRIHNAATQAFTKSKPFLAQSQIFSNNSLLLSSKAHKSITSNKGLHYAASLIRLYNELPAQLDATFLPRLTANFHRDDTDVGTALMLIQIQMQSGSLQLAAVTLEKLFHALKDRNDVKYLPGLISLAVLLFPKVGREDKATALLMEAKSYWISKGNTVYLVAKIANIQVCKYNVTKLCNSRAIKPIVGITAFPVPFTGIGSPRKRTTSIPQRVSLRHLYSCCPNSFILSDFPIQRSAALLSPSPHLIPHQIC